MADSKVSALAAAGAYNDADILYIIQGGISVKTTWGSIKTAMRTAIEYPEVANYAALPAAASHTGEIYVCLASQGSVWLLTLKDSGFYLSDGSVWTRLGALPADYFTDSVLSIADDADPTKVVKFSCAALTTLTTRTFTWPDADGTVMLVGQAPTAHKTSHENGGGDEISVAGLSGVLADPQPPIIGAGATQAVAGNDGRLTDERVPTAAGLTTKFGTNKVTVVDGDKIGILDSGASDVPKHVLFSLVKSTLKTYFDSIYTTAAAALAAAVATKLDDFAAPDDNTDLNASASAHGLMPKLDKIKFDAGKRTFIAALSADDTYSGDDVSLTAAETTAQWDVGYVNSASKIALADADAASTALGIYLATAAISIDVAGIYLESGYARNDAWSWTPGGALYLSTTPGGMTQTQPSGTDDAIVVLGVAITADIIRFKPSLIYITHT